MFKVIRKIPSILMRHNMRRQFVVAMVLSAILPLILLSFGLYYYNVIPLLNTFINHNRGLLNRQIILEQKLKTQDAVDELTDYFQEIEIQAGVLGSIIDNNALPLSYRQTVVSEYLARFPRILWIHSDKGIQAGISDSAMQSILKDAITGTLPLNQITGSSLSVSSPIQVPTHSFESVIVLSVPSIIGLDNQLFLLAELPPVNTLIDNLSVDDQVYLVDNTGKLILKSGDSPFKLGNDLTILPVVRDFVQEGVTRKAYTYKVSDGSEVRGVLEQVKLLNWGLLTQNQPSNTTGIMLEMESSATDMISRLILATVIGVLSIGLLAGALGALAAVRYTKPLLRIQKGINVVKTGNYDHYFEPSGPADIMQLSETLNSLTGSIRSSTKKLQQHAEQMREMFMGSVTALVTAIDAKDPYTRGHSRRVQVISVKIGQHMDLTARQLQELEISALMHDIGKLGVDERLLRKPGLLTTEERIALEQHPVFGAEIMRHIPMFKNMLPGMLHHHERWDGTGYPAGLVGLDIPLYGRIIAVADTFDAMTSSRPYQETLTYLESRELIVGWSGTRYDPLVVEAFESSFEEICKISESLKSVVENAATS